MNVKLLAFGTSIGAGYSVYRYLTAKPDKKLDLFKTNNIAGTIQLNDVTINFTKKDFEEKYNSYLQFIREHTDKNVSLLFSEDDHGGSVNFYNDSTVIDIPLWDLIPDRIPPEFKKYMNSDPYAVLAHELGHIENKWDKRISFIHNYLYPPIAGFLIFLPNSFISLGSICIYTVVLTVLQRRQEYYADMFACKLVGKHRYINLLRDFQQKNLKSTTWKKYFITSEGDYLLDILHPRLSTRINYCEKYTD